MLEYYCWWFNYWRSFNKLFLVNDFVVLPPQCVDCFLLLDSLLTIYDFIILFLHNSKSSFRWTLARMLISQHCSLEEEYSTEISLLEGRKVRAESSFILLSPFVSILLLMGIPTKFGQFPFLKSAILLRLFWPEYYYMYSSKSIRGREGGFGWVLPPTRHSSHKMILFWGVGTSPPSFGGLFWAIYSDLNKRYITCPESFNFPLLDEWAHFFHLFPFPFSF